MRVIPLVKGNHTILLPGEYYLKNDRELFYQEGPCLDVENTRICKKDEIMLITDECLPRIMVGHPGKCPYQKTTKMTKIMEMSANTVLTINANTTLMSDCGVTNRTITGTYIIKFENCSLEIGAKKFSNKIMETYQQAIVLPTGGLHVEKEKNY